MSEMLDNLKKLASDYAKHLDEIRNKIHIIEELPKVQALVGKYFKYQNSYGYHSKWWLYVKILRSKGTEVWIDEFEEDSNGKVEFLWNRQTGAYSYTNNTSYIQISEEEYLAAYKALIRKVIRKSKRRKQNEK